MEVIANSHTRYKVQGGVKYDIVPMRDQENKQKGVFSFGRWRMRCVTRLGVHNHHIREIRVYKILLLL